MPLDATLGVEGLPQSGTGQTTLLTGMNAAREFGRHFGPWVPVSLRPALSERNVLSRCAAEGRSACFANAYPRGWAAARSDRRPAAPPLAALGAGLLTRNEVALQNGSAVASEITNDGWKVGLGFSELPDISPETAGQNLAQIATEYSLTLFAHYATDSAGHKMELPAAVAALERVDTFMGGLFSMISDDVLVLVVSDHGNIEDVRVGHTYNPALCMAVGPSAPKLESAESLQDVAPVILDRVGIVP